MKKTVFMAVAAGLLGGCTASDSYVLKGNVEGLEGTVYMFDGEMNIVDSAKADGGKFTFRGKADVPELRTITDSRTAPASMTVVYFVEPGTAEMVAGPENPNSYRITGTPSNDANALFVEKTADLVKEIYRPETTDERFAEIEKEYASIVKEAYESNRDNYFGVMLLYGQMAYELSGREVLAEIEKLSPEMQRTEAIEELKEMSMLRMKTDVGEKFTEIVLPDADGKEISLSSVIGKEGCRYVLLDFWASWCGPCMGEVPFLKDTYAEFRGKGFEIYGVSLDSKREKWIEAIENNGMDWIHVCSFDAFQDEFAQAYAVRSIPSNFLIDSEGRIVAVNLRGHELYETVSGLMK